MNLETLKLAREAYQTRKDLADKAPRAVHILNMWIALEDMHDHEVCLHCLGVASDYVTLDENLNGKPTDGYVSVCPSCRGTGKDTTWTVDDEMGKLFP